jgi:hypothetical protein
LRVPDAVEMMDRNKRGVPRSRIRRGGAFVNHRSQDEKPSSDFLGAFGFIVLIATILYAVWTAT